MCLAGWRLRTVVLGLCVGIAMMLLFAHALSWVFALVGLSASSAGAAQAASFPILAPLVFASTAFVSATSMPGPLRWFANHQPVSIVIDAVRALTYGGQFGSTGKVLGGVAWSLAIIAISAPLAVRTYRRQAGPPLLRQGPSYRRRSVRGGRHRNRDNAAKPLTNVLHYRILLGSADGRSGGEQRKATALPFSRAPPPSLPPCPACAPC